MNQNSSIQNALETKQSRNIKFSFSSPNKFEGVINDTSKFSFKNLPGTQYSLANTEAHYRSRLLIEGSFFRQAEQSGLNQIPISKKGSIVERMEGISDKNKQKTPEIIDKRQNRDQFLTQSHVLQRHQIPQQTKLERYIKVGQNKLFYQNYGNPNQNRNNMVLTQSTPNYFQTQNIPTKRTDQTDWIETTIQRPKYSKLFDNKTQIFRTLAPDEDPKMTKTICAQWCWILWGFLGLAAAVLGIVFGLGLLPGQGFKAAGPSFITPSQPESNITNPPSQTQSPYINWIDPVPIDKVPVYTTIQSPTKYQHIRQQVMAPLDMTAPVTRVTRGKQTSQPIPISTTHAHLTSPSPLA